MNQYEFVEIINEIVLEDASKVIIETLEEPVGRFPSKKSIEESEWWNGLAQSNRDRISEQLRHTAHAAIFGMFCVLDGVRSVTGYGETAKFRLEFIKDGKTTLIGGEDAPEMLHDVLNSIYDFG